MIPRRLKLLMWLLIESMECALKELLHSRLCSISVLIEYSVTGIVDPDVGDVAVGFFQGGVEDVAMLHIDSPI